MKHPSRFCAQFQMKANNLGKRPSAFCYILQTFIVKFYALWIYFPSVIQTAMQLKTEYEERLQPHNYTYNMYAAFTYDAAWSIALMLNKSIPLLREKNQTLETMSYRDKEAAKIMRDTLFRTDFWGMSVCAYVMSPPTFFSASFDSSTNIDARLFFAFYKLSSPCPFLSY